MFVFGNDQFELSGKHPQDSNQANDPNILEAENLKRRKRLQYENLREYDNAIVSLKQKVKEMEGQDMRETIQDKVDSIHYC